MTATTTAPASATAIETIALAKLAPSKENVRRTNSQAGIEKLAASIEAHGLLQNLTVRKGAKGKFEVVAGARRLGALRHLAGEGRIAKAFPVPCHVLTDANDTEISLAENMMRSAMNAVDEIEAFRKLAADGMTPEAIGDRFGISHMTVRRRIKLAHLSPRILEAMRADEITQQQAEALALADDHATQEAVWFDAPYMWQRDPRQLRETLSKEQVKGNHRFARFVGVDAYKAAGGAIITDLFSDEGDCYLSDRPLLTRLANDKLASAAEEQGKGWSWVEPDLEGNAHHHHTGLHRIWPQRREATEAEAEELSRLGTEYDELAALMEGGSEDEGAEERASQRADAIQDRIADIEEALNGFDPVEQTFAGCIVSVNHSGELSASGGWVREEDWASILAHRNQGESAGDGSAPTVGSGSQDESPDADAGTLSAALVEELTAIRTAALRVEMIDQPRIALAAILHPLLASLFYSGLYGGAAVQSAVEVRGEKKTLDPCIQKPGSHRAVVEWTAHIESVKSALPHDAALLWDFLLEKDTDTLLALLATASAANTNAIRFRHETRKSDRTRQGDQIAEAVGLDMARWWKPDAEFLERLSKKAMGNVMRGLAVAEDRIASMQKLLKHEAVHRTEAEISGSGYMPECLTAPQLGTDEDNTGEDRAEVEEDEGTVYAEAAE
ncbi:ParB/RepB/Spo0J family partition protein [Aureimonas altamirensis]|uniref:ParB/RepB/Spo0J family partition protein n=1 Tax=Aureimonas altamirensis TaxID=370622 RepID=UPI002036C6BF|nr:ParB/RepB/Spo0J family partition protein [Aureimonas altamirensis]MCM2505644.1 ParB/RepB/Spo0J family partition protein [Aureimonas altamirensis]